jgi:hypothetical protein
MPRKGQKRLAMYIPEAWHRELKLLAERRNITVTKIILRLIYEAMRTNKGYE